MASISTGCLDGLPGSLAVVGVELLPGAFLRALGQLGLVSCSSPWIALCSAALTWAATMFSSGSGTSTFSSSIPACCRGPFRLVDALDPADLLDEVLRNLGQGADLLPAARNLPSASQSAVPGRTSR